MIKLSSYLGIDLESELKTSYLKSHGKIPVIKVEEAPRGYRVSLLGTPNLTNVGPTPESAALEILEMIQGLSHKQIQKLTRRKNQLLQELKTNPANAKNIIEITRINKLLSNAFSK